MEILYKVNYLFSFDNLVEALRLLMCSEITTTDNAKPLQISISQTSPKTFKRQKNNWSVFGLMYC